MRKLVLFVLLFYNAPSSAQIAMADSLKNTLREEVTDTTLVLTYCRISNAYFYADSDSAMHYAVKGNQLANKLKFKKGTWQSLNLIGNILKSNGAFPEALQTHLQVLQLGEQLKNKMYIASSYNNIAEVYKEQGDYENANSYYYKAKDIFMAIKSPYLINAYLNLGDNYEAMDKIDSALFYQNQAHLLSIYWKETFDLGAILTNLGNINVRIGQNDLARSYYRASIPYAANTDDKQTLYNAYIGIAKLFKDEKNIDSSFFYVRKALLFARDISNLVAINQCATLLYELFTLTKNDDSAFAYFKLATFSRDSMFTEDKVRLVQKLNFQEQQRQAKIAAGLEKAAQQRSYSLQMMGIVIFLMIFFVGLTILSKRHVRPRTIEYWGLMGLLLMFEFISYFLHPFIVKLTHHIHVLTILVTVGIAAFLVPMHHKLEHWVKVKLAHNLKSKRGRPRKTVAPKALIKKIGT